MRSPIRILYLAPCWATGRAYGSMLRTSQIARALQALGQVDFVVVKPADDEDEHSAALSAEDSLGVHRIINLRWVGSHSLWERMRDGFDTAFMGSEGQLVDPEDRTFVLSSLPRYDLVWIHLVSTANAFRQWLWPRSVMDIDDIPSAFLQTLRQNHAGVAARFRTTIRQHVAKRRERRLGDRFTTLSVCSEYDRRYLGLDGVHVIPNGFARPDHEPTRQPSQSPRLGFIGIFDYAPNIDSIRWFVEECWPRIKQHVPDARFRLVGSGSDRPLGPSGRDIDGLGWVDDAEAEIATWSAMVVPTRIGAGTRVKIAEGFSRKCPIVSTSLGAYGYGVTDGQELLLADSAEDFANACVRVIQQPQEAAAMADRAWQQFLEQWTWDAIRPRVWGAAEDCLRASRTSPERKSIAHLTKGFATRNKDSRPSMTRVGNLARQVREDWE
jgi:glycosyltransferase involved in cell wall biosynthesis